MAQTSMDYDKVLMEPYYHLISIRGKQIRNKMIEAFNHWLKISEKNIGVVKDVIELLHNCSLLIDDIEDDSELRRGIPVAHKVYGVNLTLNCGNLGYFLALQKLIEHIPQDKRLKAVQIFTEQMIELHRGQGLDIYWREKQICPSEEMYLKMVNQKTGGLFGLSIKLMELFSDWDRDLTQLSESMSQFFQIRDDYANLMSEEYEEKKSFAEDLTEGKYSFPVIHAINCNTNDSTIQDILNKHTKEIGLKKEVIKKMTELGSFEYTLVTLQRLDNKLMAYIEELGGNPMLSKIVDSLRIK